MRAFGLLAVLAAVGAAATAQDPVLQKGGIPRLTADGMVTRPPVVATGGADIRQTPTGWDVVKPTDRTEPTADASTKTTWTTGRDSGWDEINEQRRERAGWKLTVCALALGLGLLVGFVRLLWAFATPRPRARRTSESYPTWVADADGRDRR